MEEQVFTYQTATGKRVKVLYTDGKPWLSVASIALLFERTRAVVYYQIKQLPTSDVSKHMRVTIKKRKKPTQRKARSEKAYGVEIVVEVGKRLRYMLMSQFCDWCRQLPTPPNVAPDMHCVMTKTEESTQKPEVSERKVQRGPVEESHEEEERKLNFAIKTQKFKEDQIKLYLQCMNETATDEVLRKAFHDNLVALLTQK